MGSQIAGVGLSLHLGPHWGSQWVQGRKWLILGHLAALFAAAEMVPIIKVLEPEGT